MEKGEVREGWFKRAASTFSKSSKKFDGVRGCKKEAQWQHNINTVIFHFSVWISDPRRLGQSPGLPAGVIYCVNHAQVDWNGREGEWIRKHKKKKKPQLKYLLTKTTFHEPQFDEISQYGELQSRLYLKHAWNEDVISLLTQVYVC